MRLPPVSAAVVMLLCTVGACKDAPRQNRAEVSVADTLEQACPDAPCVSSALSPEDSFTMSEIDEDLFARIDGLSYSHDCTVPLSELRYLRVLHYDLEGCVREGEMICNRRIAEDLLEIFRELYDSLYPIAQMRLIDDFGASDDLSMESNNTSCFVFRRAVGQSRLSAHAYGMAVDINPLYNPYVRGEKVLPKAAAPYADRSGDFPCKLTRDCLCTRLFREHGFRWGGAWRSCKDWQHFEK